LADASMVCLPQHIWELFLMASTPSPITIPKQVSFVQTNIYVKVNVITSLSTHLSQRKISNTQGTLKIHLSG
jgi:hypothetical protein